MEALIDRLKREDALLDYETASLILYCNGHVIIYKLEPKFIDAFATYMELSLRGVFLRRIPATEDEKTFKRVYHQIKGKSGRSGLNHLNRKFVHRTMNKCGLEFKHQPKL